MASTTTISELLRASLSSLSLPLPRPLLPFLLLNPATWYLATCLTVVACLNLDPRRQRAPRMASLAAFTAVQAYFLRELPRVALLDGQHARYLGFVICMLALHVSYLVLVGGAFVVRRRAVVGGRGWKGRWKCEWDWLGAYNLASDPRGVGVHRSSYKYGARLDGGKKKEEEGGGKEKQKEKENGRTNGKKKKKNAKKTYREHGGGGKEVNGEKKEKINGKEKTDGKTQKEVKNEEESENGTVASEKTKTAKPHNTPSFSSLLSSLFSALKHRCAPRLPVLSPRQRFLVSRGAQLLALLAARAALDRGPAVSRADYAPEKAHYFRRLVPGLLGRGEGVTARETLLRLWITVAGTARPPLSISALHAASSLAHVAAGLSGPGEWPLLFGPPAAATSVRAYWSRVWHRLFAAPAVRWARWLIVCKLGLGLEPRSTPFARFLLYLGVFGVSALMHGAIESRFTPCAWPADYAAPMVHWAACTAEVLFLRCVVDRFLGRDFAARRPRLTAWLGRAWVLLFFFWWAPRYQVGKMQCLMRVARERQRQGGKAA